MNDEYGRIYDDLFSDYIYDSGLTRTRILNNAPEFFSEVENNLLRTTRRAIDRYDGTTINIVRLSLNENRSALSPFRSRKFWQYVIIESAFKSIYVEPF
jgi:hypothetical protein